MWCCFCIYTNIYIYPFYYDIFGWTSSRCVIHFAHQIRKVEIVYRLFLFLFAFIVFYSTELQLNREKKLSM